MSGRFCNFMSEPGWMSNRLGMIANDALEFPQWQDQAARKPGKAGSSIARGGGVDGFRFASAHT